LCEQCGRVGGEELSPSLHEVIIVFRAQFYPPHVSKILCVILEVAFGILKLFFRCLFLMWPQKKLLVPFICSSNLSLYFCSAYVSLLNMCVFMKFWLFVGI
jgi:hypothetical protein